MSTEPRGLVVVPCADLDAAVDHYRQVGFQLDAIGPADEPTWAELSVAGLTVRLDTKSSAVEPRLELRAAHQEELPPFFAAPDAGNSAANSSADAGVVPETTQTLAVAHESAEGWIRGRAGMLYRDLVPDRHGGAYIASHIHIPIGGPVPDYVHHHDVSYQLIYCHRGWVRVVYQDQGEPFILEPGDCVLQPPGIRHRVLEASDDLFVTEITCPAVHRTFIDNELELPTKTVDADRRFGGQLFVRHVGSVVPWSEPAASGLASQVTAIGAATDDLAELRVLRADADQRARHDLNHDGDFLFVFLVSGTANLVDPDGDVVGLSEGSSVAVPAGENFGIDGATTGTAFLELRSRRP